MDEYARTPSTVSRFGLTGISFSANGPLSRLCTSVRPTVPCLSEAPITAMEWGSKKTSMETFFNGFGGTGIAIASLRDGSKVMKGFQVERVCCPCYLSSAMVNRYAALHLGHRWPVLP